MSEVQTQTQTQTPAPIEAHCMKCKTKRVMQNPVAVYNANGTPATKGTCASCGTMVFRMGATPAHAGLPKPIVQPRAARTPASANGTKAKRKQSKAADLKRSGKLVIVESPSKAKTIGKYLGHGYQVKASVGHIRDLLRSQLSVDVTNDFAPKYRVPNQKKEVVKELQAAAAKAAEIYLATDPDREGEAIAWHLIEAATIPPDLARRVTFNEITQGAIREAFANPRAIDMRLVNAQQARRILDRLVGYQISPLLWEKVRGGLSAGRVQSAAVRLVVEREREIMAFVPVEYWSLAAELAKIATRKSKPRPSFIAKLVKVRGADADLKNQADADAIVKDLEGAAYIILKVKKSERRRNSPAPFMTSTLQQEASRRLGFSTKKTMVVAQQLYEGIELTGEGTVGLITYMRTDSTNVAKIAQDEARAFIAEKYGAEFVPPSPPTYKTRHQNAQEAHEAIRPTAARREPAAIKNDLDRDQFRLYDLIWKRFIASQMEGAVFDVTTVEAGANREWHISPDTSQVTLDERYTHPPYLFRSTGSVVKFMGFLAVYDENGENGASPKGDKQSDDEIVGKILPPLSEGEVVDLLRLLPEQHFTEPPPRYSEATLVKALEENGIGRPSTYAPTISTISSRGYVETKEKRLHPTEIGFVVNDLLVAHFPEVVDLGFTAQMEEELDEIADGTKEWVPVLHDFYTPFAQSLKKAETMMPNVKVEDEPTGEVCELCGLPLVVKRGRFGKFISCSNYPTCKRKATPFLIKVGVDCPKDSGALLERKTRRGRLFYGCANYPNCDFTSWNRPVAQKCPQDGGLMVIASKGKVKCTVCETIYEQESDGQLVT
jgi:DNA topoisomerase-1